MRAILGAGLAGLAALALVSTFVVPNANAGHRKTAAAQAAVKPAEKPAPVKRYATRADGTQVCWRSCMEWCAGRSTATSCARVCSSAC